MNTSPFPAPPGRLSRPVADEMIECSAKAKQLLALKLATWRAVRGQLWVKNGRGAGSTDTSPIPLIADDFVRPASRQLRAKNGPFITDIGRG